MRSHVFVVFVFLPLCCCFSDRLRYHLILPIYARIMLCFSLSGQQYFLRTLNPNPRSVHSYSTLLQPIQNATSSSNERNKNTRSGHEIQSLRGDASGLAKARRTHDSSAQTERSARQGAAMAVSLLFSRSLGRARCWRAACVTATCSASTVSGLDTSFRGNGRSAYPCSRVFICCLGSVPGHEVVGTVADVGSDVSAFKVGTQELLHIIFGCRLVTTLVAAGTARTAFNVLRLLISFIASFVGFVHACLLSF